ncbi:hypothetical protein ISCGN_026726 [Ixodes scapularis]
MDSRRPPFTANLAVLQKRLAMLGPLRRRRLSHEPDAITEPRPADETLQVETCNVSSRSTCTPSGAAISLSSDDADGSQAYGTTFGLFLGGSSYSSSDGTPLPLPLLSDVVMAKVQTEVAAVATTQVRKWTGGPGVAGR